MNEFSFLSILTTNKEPIMALSTFSDNDLDFFIENDFNVIFEGKHGVGKTHIIMEAFRRNGLKALYISGGTCDPWVDVVGVPKPMKTTDGKMYLDLVRPKAFVTDDIEAIFIDEYSRSHKRVRNAMMELIQFKSINGHRMPHLRVVWAAINPHDDEGTYDTEKLDPAQMDRFQVHINVPYKPTKSYFIEKYGKAVAEPAVDWWNELPTEVKDMVSPRRLDYALEMNERGGDLQFVLPSESNPNKLALMLMDGPMLEKLWAICDDDDHEAAAELIESDPNTVDCILKNLGTEGDKFIQFWLDHTPADNVADIVSLDDAVLFNVATSATVSRSAGKLVTSMIRSRNQEENNWKILWSLVSPRKKRDNIVKPIAAVAKNNPYRGLLMDVCSSLGIVVKDAKGDYVISSEHLQSHQSVNTYLPVLSKGSDPSSGYRSYHLDCSVPISDVPDFLSFATCLLHHITNYFASGLYPAPTFIWYVQAILVILVRGPKFPESSDMGCLAVTMLRFAIYEYCNKCYDANLNTDWINNVIGEFESRLEGKNAIASDSIKVIQAVNGGMFAGITATPKKVKVGVSTKKSVRKASRARAQAKPAAKASASASNRSTASRSTRSTRR